MKLQTNMDIQCYTFLYVAHCELNPIELAWASVKNYIAKHNTRYTLEEVQQLTPEAFAHTTTDMWRNFCKHVVDVENDYNIITKDGIREDTLEEMTLTLILIQTVMTTMTLTVT